jgi:multiple sugar transport system ATP-binding protein
MNLFEGQLNDDASAVRLGSQVVSLPALVHEVRPAVAAYAGRKVVVGMRPEDLPAADGSTTEGQRLQADVVLVEALGSELLVHFSIDAERVHVDAAEERGDDELQTTGELVVHGQGVARVQPRMVVKTGDRAEFVLHSERMHFFDPDTQQAIVA